jgi:hypothetical protein
MPLEVQWKPDFETGVEEIDLQHRYRQSDQSMIRLMFSRGMINPIICG